MVEGTVRWAGALALELECLGTSPDLATFGKLLDVSGPQFHQLQNGDESNTYLIGCVRIRMSLFPYSA